MLVYLYVNIGGKDKIKVKDKKDLKKSLQSKCLTRVNKKKQVILNEL